MYEPGVTRLAVSVISLSLSVTIPPFLRKSVRMFDELKRIKIYKKLTWLNELPDDEAVYVLRECGGSEQWARRMSELRPFVMIDDLFEKARRYWAVSPDGDADKYSEASERLGKLLER